MNRIIDYGISAAIFVTTLLVTFALAGVSAGQDKPPQAPPADDTIWPKKPAKEADEKGPIEPPESYKKLREAEKKEVEAERKEAERREEIRRELDEAQKDQDFTPLKGAIDEGYDKPDPVKPAPRFTSREAFLAAAWKDKTLPFTPKLPTVFNSIADGKAAAKKSNNPYMIFAGKDSLTSRAGGLLAEELASKAVLIHLENGFGNETDAQGSRLLFMDKSGEARFVSMHNCDAQTAARIDGGMAKQFVDGVNESTKAAAPPVLRAKAPIVMMQAAPVQAKAARAPVRSAPVRRGG